ncbi:hypothetical protein SAMN05216361_1505 [Marisediminitalea aggregata]|uniref:Uncharacterized protein n=1 Tax=Marisediminitalea aggregata TaxID=634436 RepID=A0A1M5HK30_9ALTE|nr:hypothetical protein [Marisediminitalea aggregata]SHG16314.1 hypothetical protein SAMN05216361_1505 [Marisediminitalea aggregata]
MSFLTIEYSSQEAHRAIQEANARMEQVEVLLSNLLALRHPEDDKFIIPFDDVIVSLETAVKQLRI